VHNLVNEYLRRTFYSNPNVRINLPILQDLVTSGKLSPTAAAQQLFSFYEGGGELHIVQEAQQQ